MDPQARRAYFFRGDVEKARKTIGPLPEPWPRPVLVVLSGLPGTGKSYLARRLIERIPLAVVSTDAVRLALVRRPRYTWLENQRVYDVCHMLVDELLANDIPTVFDATNLIEGYRRTVYSIAERNNAKLVIVETVAPPGAIRDRMDRRVRKEDQLDRSEADWHVYLKLKKNIEPIERQHFIVDTSEDIEPALDQIVEGIRNQSPYP